MSNNNFHQKFCKQKRKKREIYIGKEISSCGPHSLRNSKVRPSVDETLPMPAIHETKNNIAMDLLILLLNILCNYSRMQRVIS